MEIKRSVLVVRMLVRFVVGFLLLGALLFISAGSLSYTNGWIFIITMAVPMVVFGVTLLIKAPAVLARRMQSSEPDKTQRAVVAVSALMFIASFVLAGFNYRFSWPGVPLGVVIAGVAVMLIGYAMFAAVILQNAYAARVVDVVENQKIITTGLYAIVRHPMYTANILLFLAMPFALGSWIATLPMLLYPFIIARRIKNEEALLVRELDGYAEYTRKVKYRLLPLVW